MTIRNLFATCAAMALAVPAVAADVPFTASVGGVVCALFPVTPGQLAPDGDGDVLASTESGGVAGTLVATVAGGAALSVSDPTDWTLDPEDAGGTAPATTTFDATVTGSGATTFSELGDGDTAQSLANGVTNLTVDLSASAATAFPAGTYRADVTVTCEAAI